MSLPFNGMGYEVANKIKPTPDTSLSQSERAALRSYICISNRSKLPSERTTKSLAQNSWVLSGCGYIVYTQWVMSIATLRCKFLLQKKLLFTSKGQLLHCNCSRFAMQLGLRCTPKVVLLQCNEALSDEKHEDWRCPTTKKRQLKTLKSIFRL